MEETPGGDKHEQRHAQDSVIPAGRGCAAPGRARRRRLFEEHYCASGHISDCALPPPAPHRPWSGQVSRLPSNTSRHFCNNTCAQLRRLRVRIISCLTLTSCNLAAARSRRARGRRLCRGCWQGQGDCGQVECRPQLCGAHGVERPPLGGSVWPEGRGQVLDRGGGG